MWRFRWSYLAAPPLILYIFVCFVICFPRIIFRGDLFYRYLFLYTYPELPCMRYVFPRMSFYSFVNLWYHALYFRPPPTRSSLLFANVFYFLFHFLFSLVVFLDWFALGILVVSYSGWLLVVSMYLRSISLFYIGYSAFPSFPSSRNAPFWFIIWLICSALCPSCSSPGLSLSFPTSYCMCCCPL